MVIRDALRGNRVYFDANIFIYLIEGFHEMESQILEIRDTIANSEADIFTSELTLCEVLVRPFRDNQAGLVSQYRQFIEESGAFSIQPTNRETYLRASLYCAQLGLKTADAIHVATAIETGCDIFLTNDARIRLPNDMKRVLFS